MFVTCRNYLERIVKKIPSNLDLHACCGQFRRYGCLSSFVLPWGVEFQRGDFQKISLDISDRERRSMNSYRIAGSL